MGSSRSSKKAGKALAPLVPYTSNRRHESFGSDESYSNEWSSEKNTQSSSSAYYDRVTPSRTSTSSTTKSNKPGSPTVNQHTYCGRHSSQWLFGGISVRETIKSTWKKE